MLFRSKNSLPLNDVGLINYLTVGWISKLMWKALKVYIYSIMKDEVAKDS